MASNRNHTKHIRKHRRKLRETLLQLLGAWCLFCLRTRDDGVRLEFAHRIPVRRIQDERGRQFIKIDGRLVRDGIDTRLRDVRNHPFSYVVVCRDCHLSLDGPAWGTIPFTGPFRGRGWTETEQTPYPTPRRNFPGPAVARVVVAAAERALYPKPRVPICVACRSKGNRSCPHLDGVSLPALDDEARAYSWARRHDIHYIGIRKVPLRERERVPFDESRSS